MNSLALERRAVAATPKRRLAASALFLWANAIALLVVAVFLRCWHLGNIPGFNGDEAWYGVQAATVARGDDIAWLTPTGNPINPFFLMPLVALHYYFGPSIVLLRSVALVSGLAALVANYVLCRRAFDELTAVISTLFLAILPIDIAYSRFAWDASQSLLVTLLVVYLPLIRLRESDGSSAVGGWAIGACVAAVYVHPTNVFIAMFLIAPVVYVRRQWLAATLRHARVPARPWVFAGLAILLAAGVSLTWQVGPALLSRLHGPQELGLFAANYLQLFSGTSIYQFLSGAGLNVADAGWFEYTTVAGNFAFGAVGLAALWGLFRRVEKSPDAVDACLVLSWLAMLAAFFIVAGPQAIAPHFERYGICLIGPGALIVARGLGWWIEQARPHGRRWAIVLAAAAWLWPVSFSVNYFQCFLATGGLSHYAFRTAAEEPKRAALEYILEHRQGDRPIRIVCHEWWNYWPAAYLAMREPGVSVVTWDAWRTGPRSEDSSQSEDTWFIEFAGSAGQQEVFAVARASGRTLPWQTIIDYGRRPVIVTIGPLESVSENN